MTQRHHASATTISWIPSEAMTGIMKAPMELGLSHYDPPPPDHIEDLAALRDQDRFRFANRVSAWIDVDEAGAITGAGSDGGGMIGATRLRLGTSSLSIPAVPFDDITAVPDIHADRAVFVQTSGGRTGAPMPRTVSRPPFIQITAPSAWTTLRLTIHRDGSSDVELIGASPFPRHWVYDTAGNLVAKSGVTDYARWSKDAFGDNTPWGDTDSPALVTAVATALERTLSVELMQRGESPEIRRLAPGSTLVRQGDPGTDLSLVLDGVLSVEVDCERIAEIGPGAIVGERAILEGGTRTSTLVAITPVRVAVAARDRIDVEHLAELARHHRREDATP